MGIDVVFVPDMPSAFRAYLLMMDGIRVHYASLAGSCGKCKACPAGRADSQTVAPLQIQIDQDRALRGVFEQVCRDLGVPLAPIPADAQFTSDKIERRVQLAKIMAEKGVHFWMCTMTWGQGGWRTHRPDMLQVVQQGRIHPGTVGSWRRRTTTGLVGRSSE